MLLTREDRDILMDALTQYRPVTRPVAHRQIVDLQVRIEQEFDRGQLLLADALARVEGKNIDGSDRRETRTT